jgi:small subunit ribosomal protein S1
MLTVGQEVTAKILKFDQEKNRVSLGVKQLGDDPWVGIARRYPPNTRLFGKVTNLTDYGAFVEIESGIEGLVHVSEMSWLKNNSTPNKFINSGQEVEVMVLDINSQNHRISLGMKQCEKNPWQAFSESHQVGDVVEGVVKNFTEFGLFIGFDSGVDGLVHVSDISSEGTTEEILKKFKKDEKVKVMVLGSNYEKERISLGIRQLGSTTFKDELNRIEAGLIVSCLIINVKKDFLEVELDSGLKAIIKRLDLSNNKQEQRTERYEVGDRIEAKVMLFNKVSGKLLLSIKDMETDEQEAHLYSANDSGNTIGSIHGDVLESLSVSKESKE